MLGYLEEADLRRLRVFADHGFATLTPNGITALAAFKELQDNRKLVDGGMKRSHGHYGSLVPTTKYVSTLSCERQNELRRLCHLPLVPESR